MHLDKLHLDITSRLLIGYDFLDLRKRHGTMSVSSGKLGEVDV